MAPAIRHVPCRVPLSSGALKGQGFRAAGASRPSNSLQHLFHVVPDHLAQRIPQHAEHEPEHRVHPRRLKVRDLPVQLRDRIPEMVYGLGFLGGESGGTPPHNEHSRRPLGFSIQWGSGHLHAPSAVEDAAFTLTLDFIVQNPSRAGPGFLRPPRFATPTTLQLKLQPQLGTGKVGIEQRLGLGCRYLFRLSQIDQHYTHLAVCLSPSRCRTNGSSPNWDARLSMAFLL